MLEELKNWVWKANLELDRSGLVKLTWGNVSGIDRDHGMVVMKPSGVPYSDLQPDHMVILDLDGKVVEGHLNPSSDTRTHLCLYKSFPKIGGVTHSHSVHATQFAQACREIPCFGTTHADYFFGPVPLARALTPDEVTEDYVGNTGKVIVERFAKLNPTEVPGVLVSHHGPFTWGKNAMDSVRNNIALEVLAEMALGTIFLNPSTGPIPKHISDKHFLRKHGPNATYGQKA